MAFREYITSKRLAGVTQQGRFVVDAQEDGDLPDARTWGELEAYLVGKNCSRELLEDAAGVWRDYEDSIGLER
jgi:hypothetical protein